MNAIGSLDRTMNHNAKVKVLKSQRIGFIEKIRPSMQIGDVLLPEKYIVRHGFGQQTGWLAIEELQLIEETVNA